MAAVATVNPATGSIDSVSFINQGTDMTTYDPAITFIGGLNFTEVLITADVADADNDASITEVSLYVNGTLYIPPLNLDTNPDTKAPYQMLWSPERSWII